MIWEMAVSIGSFSVSIWDFLSLCLQRGEPPELRWEAGNVAVIERQHRQTGELPKLRARYHPRHLVSFTIFRKSDTLGHTTADEDLVPRPTICPRFEGTSVVFSAYPESTPKLLQRFKTHPD